MRQGVRLGGVSTGEAQTPRVFIIYSHDSDEHKERVLALADRLRKDGIEVRLDRYLPSAGPEVGWAQWRSWRSATGTPGDGASPGNPGKLGTAGNP